MSELEQTTPEPVEPPEAPSLRRSRRPYYWLGGGLAALLSVAAIALCFWASSATFENLVRRELIAHLQAATGGRVEIRSFHWHLFGLEAEAGGVVIHGLEAPGEAPYAKVDRLRVGLSVLGFLSPRILLHNLEADGPAFHLIVYPGGSTNLPRPRLQHKSRKPALDTFFDLKAGHIAIRNGQIDYENRAAAFDYQDRLTLLDLDASDVSLRAAYVPAAGANPESYRIEAAAAHLNVFRGNPQHGAQTARGRVDASLDLIRNAAYLRAFQLSSEKHVLSVTGSLQNFAHPQWQAKVTGELDLRLVDPATGYGYAPEGIARLDLSAAGYDGQFRTDGTVHVEHGSYIGTGVVAKGFNLDARVHADPDRLLITSIAVKLRPGGEIDGDLALEHWLPPVPGTPALRSGIPPASHLLVPHARLSLLPPPSDIEIPVNGKVSAQFKDVSLDTLMDMVGSAPFLRLGLDARLNGPAQAVWTGGDQRTLTVSANLAMHPSAHFVAGESPTSGLIDATYNHRDGAVEVRKLDLHLPASEILAHGHLGAYPLSSPSSLAVDFRSHDLWEFDPVLHDLGLKRNGRTGAAALGAVLNGQAEFHGLWTGSLIQPHLAGNAKASNLALELPPDPKDTSGKPQFLRWDAIEATGSYTGARIAFDRAQLHKGPATLDLSGTLDATPGKSPTFDGNSMLRAHLRAAGVSAGEVLSLTQKSLPVSGALSTQIEIEGPLHNPGATGWVELDGGSIYGEPVTRIKAQGKFAGQQIHLTSLSLSEAAGSLSATGNYDLKSRRFQVDAKAAGVDVSHIDWLRRQGLAISGRLGFALSGSGSLDDPHVQAHATLASLALGGEPLGSLSFTAHTADHAAVYDMTTRLEAAAVTMHGRTALDGDNATQAEFDFSRFNIGALLKLAHVSGLSGESALAGKITIAGPLAKPDALRGEARLQELAVTVAGVHLRSVGDVHATLANNRVNLDVIHVTGEETDLHAQGAINLSGDRHIDLAASGSVNLKLAQSVDPDLTASGTTTFQLEAHGPLNNPGLRGRVDCQNGALALEDVPNGLSQIRGHLEFNQNRLEVKSLTATTGGGQLSLSGYLAYQNGFYADLTATGTGIRIRYPQGISSLADARLRLQGTPNNSLLSGNVLITRFTMSPDLDVAALAAAQSSSVQTIVAANAPSNHVRLDVRLVSSPQLNFQNAYAKLAGDVDLRIRGTLATPSLLGRVSITEGSAMIAGTRYELQRGDITFANPVRIQPSINLNATAHVSDYDITLGLHGTPDKLAVTYRSDPPLPEADVVALLALGRTENQQRIYTQQQEQTGANPTTDLLLGGALNATVSSRVQKLFGAGSVKVDPNYLGTLGNSTSRIIVEEQLGPKVTLTYATNVNSTAQQLIQAEVAINHHVSVMVARDESGVFSVVFKATRRYR